VEGNVEIFINESEIDWRRELKKKGLKLSCPYAWFHT
jgi:hypothetical protein